MIKELKYKNSLLLPYRKEHFSKTILWLNTPEVYQKFGITKRITRESHEKWFKSLEDTYIWAIHDIDSRIYCGNILLFVNENHNSAFFQIYLGDTRFRGKRIGESSLIAMINYAFHELKLHRISLQVFADNQVAIHLYEKLGFVYEGIEREAHYSNTVYKSQLRYSLLQDEWVFESED